MRIYTAEKETGNIIESVKSITDGLKRIALYKHKDSFEGIEAEYDIVNEYGESVLYSEEVYSDYINDMYFADSVYC